MTSLLKLEEVSLYYKTGFKFFRSRKKVALDGLTFEVRRGDKLGVLGRNGAGKSSLLKLLAGIYKPDSGQYFAMQNSRSAFIGLQQGFVPYMTGSENIMLTGILMGMSKSEVQVKRNEIINFSELGTSINEPVYSYSSGMKARLAFAVSAFSNPDLLLIDEAMSVGDRSFRMKSREKISELIAGDAAVILVSHEANLIASVCSKALWLENGCIVERGVSSDVAERYQKSFDSEVHSTKPNISGRHSFTLNDVDVSENL